MEWSVYKCERKKEKGGQYCQNDIVLAFLGL